MSRRTDSRIDSESKRKLREMGVATLVDALDAQDESLTLGMVFEERLKLAVDDAHAAYTHAKVDGLIRRAGLRYPDADLRRLDLLEERGLDRGVIAQLGTCQFITRHQNVVFQGFTGSGKSYLGSALATQACTHRYRAHYIRMPDLEESWAAAKDRPGGKEKWLRKYAAFTLLVIDEWLLDPPTDEVRSMLLELLERRYDATSTVFCTQYAKVLHPVRQEGLAPTPRLRRPRRRHHGPHRPPHHLDRDRKHQHARAHQGHRLNPAGERRPQRWRSPAPPSGAQTRYHPALKGNIQRCPPVQILSQPVRRAPLRRRRAGATAC